MATDEAIPLLMLSLREAYCANGVLHRTVYFTDRRASPNGVLHRTVYFTVKPPHHPCLSLRGGRLSVATGLDIRPQPTLTISTEISTAGVVPLFSSQCVVFLSSGQPNPGSYSLSTPFRWSVIVPCRI